MHERFTPGAPHYQIMNIRFVPMKGENIKMRRKYHPETTTGAVPAKNVKNTPPCVLEASKIALKLSPKLRTTK